MGECGPFNCTQAGSIGLTETRRHKHEVSGKDGALLTVSDYMRMPLEDLRKRIAEINAALAEE